MTRAMVFVWAMALASACFSGGGGSEGSGGEGAAGESGGLGCEDYCSRLLANVDAVSCAGDRLEQLGYPVTQMCDRPNNVTECVACTDLVGVPASACRETVAACLE